MAKTETLTTIFFLRYSLNKKLNYLVYGINTRSKGAFKYYISRFLQNFRAPIPLVGLANWWFHQLALATLWEPIFQLWLSKYSLSGNLQKSSLKNITVIMLNSGFNEYSTLRISMMGQEKALKDDYACLSKGKFQTF